MTTRDEAQRTAMAYAWGCEDSTGTKTAVPAGGISGDWAFGETYAQGQDDYNEQRRGDFIPVRDAYANWQASGGRSVFQRGQLTLSDDRRRELRAAWLMVPNTDTKAFTAYYDLRDQYQAEAWDAAGTETGDRTS